MSDLIYEAISFDDKNITYVKLPSGIYLVDGEVVRNSSYGLARVQCKDPNNICIIRENKYIKEYRCGEDVITVEEFNRLKNDLEKECLVYIDDDGCNSIYKDLDSEFKYRKFISSWKAIWGECQVISDPIKVEIDHIVYDTKNKYIRSAFLNGEKEDTLYSYYQNEAWRDILKECFDSLGMKYQERLSYNHTANKKVWSNNNDGIRFAVAFGTYIFNDNFGNPRVIKGTLEDVKKKYVEDKDRICSIVRSKYMQHFGNIDCNRFDFDGLLNNLKITKRNLERVKVIKKSHQDYYSVLKGINEAIAKIENSFTVKIEDN